MGGCKNLGSILQVKIVAPSGEGVEKLQSHNLPSGHFNNNNFYGIFNSYKII